MASELRKTILEVADLQAEVIDVPEWGVKVKVQGMSGVDRARFLRSTSDRDGKVSIEKFYPDLVITTTYDPETDERVFDQADRDSLNRKSGAALDRIAKVAMRLSGIGGDAVEEIEADLDETRSDDSS